jgi:hypothetical protein
MELDRTPIGGLFFLHCAGQNCRSFFADGVLVPAIVLEIDDAPGLRADERGEIRGGHDFSLAVFAIFAGGGAGQLGEQPHTSERDAGAEAGGGFGDKTSAARFENTEDFVEDGRAIANDEEEAGDDDGVDGVGRIAESVNVAVGEGAVLQAAAGGSGFGSCDEAFGEIDASGVDLRVLLGESTGVEAGAAAELKDVGAGSGSVGSEERAGDLLGVIAEEILAAEGVEPGAAFEQAVGRMRGGMRNGSAGHFAVAGFHSLPCKGLNVRFGRITTTVGD